MLWDQLVEVFARDIDAHDKACSVECRTCSVECIPIAEARELLARMKAVSDGQLLGPLVPPPADATEVVFGMDDQPWERVTVESDGIEWRVKPEPL